jgi:hypothetical protein
VYAANDPLNKIDPTGQQYDLVSDTFASSFGATMNNIEFTLGSSLIEQLIQGGDAGIYALAGGIGVFVAFAGGPALFKRLLSRNGPKSVATAQALAKNSGYGALEDDFLQGS